MLWEILGPRCSGFPATTRERPAGLTHHLAGSPGHGRPGRRTLRASLAKNLSECLCPPTPVAPSTDFCKERRPDPCRPQALRSHGTKPHFWGPPGQSRGLPRPRLSAGLQRVTCNLASGSRGSLLWVPAGLGGPGRAGFPSRLFSPRRLGRVPSWGPSTALPQSRCVLNT